MESSIIFKPRPSAGWAWLGGIGLVVLVTTALPVLPLLGRSASPGLVWPLLLGLVIGLVFITLAIFFPGMAYGMRPDALELHYGPWTVYRIPYDQIQKVSWQDLSISLWSSFRLPGFALFSVQYSDVGSVKMCASAAATRILLIKTNSALYGITPADEHAFTTALMERVRR